MYADSLPPTKHTTDATLKQNYESEGGDWNDRLSNPLTTAKQAGTSATADWTGDTLNKGDDKDLWHDRMLDHVSKNKTCGGGFSNMLRPPRLPFARMFA